MEGEGQVNGIAAPIEDGEPRVRALRPSLLSLLIEAEVAPEQELRAAATAGMGAGERLGDVVLRNGWLDEPGLATLVARQWSLPFVSDAMAVVDAARDDVLPPDQAEELGAGLIASDDGAPIAAVAEPTTERLGALRQRLGPSASFAVVTPTTLARLAAERRPAQDGDLDALIETLMTATGKVTGFRERIAELTAAKQETESELERARERVAELDRLLAEERARSRSLRGKLAALIDELGD